MARRPPGALEDAVIESLGAGGEMTVPEVLSVLDEELAYTTVMTTLVRLTEKGLVRRTKHGRSYRYQLAADPMELPSVEAALRMRRELDGRGRRADVLANFVDALDADDESTLRRLLREREGRGEARP